MAVDSRHPQYTEWLPRWKRCRDTARGEDTVKQAGETYLPRPSGQSDSEYLAYRTRAYWFNATARTIDGLTGLIFRKEPLVEAPQAMKPWLEDVTLGGVSLRELASQITEEVIITGRAGLMVDYPPVELGDDATVAQQEASGARPYLTLYQAEHITNWRHERVGGRRQLTQVVLEEQEQVQRPDDEFELQQVPQYRVLELVDGQYRQRLYRKQMSEERQRLEWQVVAEFIPQVNGAPLPYIPFWFVGVSRSDGVVENPPVYDLANVNLSHYRTLADLENGAHWTGLPTPVFIGLSDDEQEVTLGSTEGIVLPIGGDAKYLEFSGKGLEALEKRAAAKEQEMAVLGARILAPERRQAEAAETAAIHRAGENGVLASIANTISRTITAALQLAAQWGGIAETDVQLRLNTDYLAVQMSPQMLTALTQALQAGTISHQDYFWYLQRGDVIAEERDYEEMQADIETNPPAGLVGQPPVMPEEDDLDEDEAQ